MIEKVLASVKKIMFNVKVKNGSRDIVSYANSI